MDDTRQLEDCPHCGCAVSDREKHINWHSWEMKMFARHHLALGLPEVPGPNAPATAPSAALVGERAEAMRPRQHPRRGYARRRRA